MCQSSSNVSKKKLLPPFFKKALLDLAWSLKKIKKLKLHVKYTKMSFNLGGLNMPREKLKFKFYQIGKEVIILFETN